MILRKLSIAAMVTIILQCQALAAQTKLPDVVIVDVFPDNESGVSHVTIEEEDDSLMDVPKPQTSGKPYAGTVDLRSVEGYSGAANPAKMTVTVLYGDELETIYLNIKPRVSPISIYVFHNEPKSEIDTAKKIDARAVSIKNSFINYFDARWAYLHSQSKDSILAIKFAKFWFEASVQLAIIRESAFRLDPLVLKTMTDYEERAKSDSSFSQQYRKVVPEGIVNQRLNQVKASEFQDVNLVQKFIASGQFSEAATLNAALVAKFKELEPDKQTAVTRFERIDEKLLLNNQIYIEKLM